MNVRQPALLAELLGLFVGFVPYGPVLNDLSSVGARGIDLRLRGVRGHHHYCFHLVDSSCDGYALRMVPGRRADHATLPLLRRELPKLVQRTTDLVRAAPLEHLRLETNVKAGFLTKQPRGQ